MKKILIILLTVIASAAAAIPQDSTIVLTLDEVLKIALKNNYDMQLSELSLQTAEAQINEAYAGAFPSLNFSGRYTRNLKSPVLFIPPNTPFNPGPTTQKFSIGADNSYDLGVSLSQTIFDPRLGTAITIAEKYQEYSASGNRQTRDEVQAEVKKTFYSILLAKNLVEVTRQGYDVARANFENTAKLYKQGVVSEFDMLRAEVQLANVEPALIEARNNLELAKNALKILLVMDLDTKIDAAGRLEIEEVPADLIDRGEEILLDSNPSLKQLNIQRDILAENVDIEKAAYLPTLSGFGNYAWQAQDNTFDFSNYAWANTITVGLQLSYPIFDGFRRSAKIEQAEIQLKSIDVTKNKAAEGLKIALEQARLKMTEAKDRITAQGKSVEQAERALKIAETRYREGIGTQLEIMDSQNSLTQARINYERGVYDYLTAKTDWEMLLGR